MTVKPRTQDYLIRADVVAVTLDLTDGDLEQIMSSLNNGKRYWLMAELWKSEKVNKETFIQCLHSKPIPNYPIFINGNKLDEINKYLDDNNKIYL